MASAATETTPLVAPQPSSPVLPAPRRTVTFTADTRLGSPPNESNLRPKPRTVGPPGLTQASGVSGQPLLSSLNSKLRRRNSHGAPILAAQLPTSKIGPQRTTKNAQKLKLLPNPDPGDDGPDEESGRDVYSQFTRIKDPSARRDAARLGKADRDRLPRVTAYCTSSAYKMDGLMRFLKSKTKTRGTNPKQFDECIYSAYDYNRSKKAASAVGADDSTHLPLDGPPMSASPRVRSLDRRQSDTALVVNDGILEQSFDETEESDMIARQISPSVTSGSMDLPSSLGTSLATFATSPQDLDTHVHTPEVFLFDYGTVVIWGMSLEQEERFLREIAKFETEKLASDDVQTENFNFYYTSQYQARIYNDFISLREKKNYMTKLAISHALAQSVKTSLYEDLLSTTIEETTPFPALLATTGTISLSRRAINQRIGELFILRINIHLQGSVLDSPELMWAEPQLEPVYGAVRSYLEMDQRVGLLNERLDVLGDLLAVLKDQVGTKHGEYLEWIVIVLIAAEILVAAVNIVVDLYAGVD